MRYSKAAKAAWMACVLALPLLAQCSHAQTAPIIPQTTGPQTAGPQTAGPQTAGPQTTEAALHAMSQLAAVIFTGQVVAVRQRQGINGATGVFEIDFAVEDAVQGVSSSLYTLREWAGLWPSGNQPFRVGQCFLMLLHAPGPAGLSSPIGGTDGAVPLRGNRQPLDPQAAAEPDHAAFANPAPPDGFIVDLRWIATHASQPASYQQAQPTALALSAHPNTNFPDLPDTALTPQIAAPANSQATPYATVLSMLRAWSRGDQENQGTQADHAAR